MAGWAYGLPGCKLNFCLGNITLVFWPSQADDAYRGQVNFMFSVLLLVSIFTERFGEESG